jgi:hypothetical protein
MVGFFKKKIGFYRWKYIINIGSFDQVTGCVEIRPNTSQHFSVEKIEKIISNPQIACYLSQDSALSIGMIYSIYKEYIDLDNLSIDEILNHDYCNKPFLYSEPTMLRANLWRLLNTKSKKFITLEAEKIINDKNIYLNLSPAHCIFLGFSFGLQKKIEF